MQIADYFRYHGLGNDYLVIDPALCAVSMTGENIRLLCQRNFGIGSDGILYGPLASLVSYSSPALQVSRASQASLHLRIWNPDGSEAEKSGNGIRIFAQYLLEQGYVQGPKFSLESLGGRVHVEVIDFKNHIFKVAMGYATMHAQEVPVNIAKFNSHNSNELGEVMGRTLTAGKRDFVVNCVSVGNPHCVIIEAGGKGKISAAEACIYGPLLENHPAFPKRSNVQFLKVLDEHSVQIEIWERGAGYTLASGTSSCAAATAAWRNGLVVSPVRVLMPGGEVTVTITPLPNSSVSVASKHEHKWRHACAILELTGPVSSICHGMFAPDLRRRLQL